MAHLGAVTFSGHSGERYRFQVWPVGTKFKPLAAVCLFTKRSFSNRNFADTASHECLHIGHTADLSALSYDAAYAAGSDCICVHVVADAAEREAVERDLAAALGVWNQKFHVELGGRAPADAISPPAA